MTPLSFLSLARGERSQSHIPTRVCWLFFVQAAVVLLQLLVLVSKPANASPFVRTVLHDNYSPVINGETFHQWSQYLTVPALNNAGLTAFVAQGSDQVILSEISENELRVVARNGDAAPGASGLLFGSLRHPALNDNGTLAFSGLLVDADDNLRGWGIWTAQSTGVPSLVARPGDSVPGHPGLSFYSLGNPTVSPASPPLLSRDGALAFRATIFDQTTLYPPGIVLRSAESSVDLQTLVGLRDIAPGTNGAVFNGFWSLAMNDAGSIGFVSGLYKDGGEISNNSVLWLMPRNEPLRMSFRQGDPAPGVPDRPFSSFQQLAINNVNELGLIAWLEPDNENSPSPSGIWAGPDNNLRLVAASGSLAPGTSAHFQNFDSVLINTTGRVAFRGDIQGQMGERAGIWLEGANRQVGLVALVNEVASDTDGARFQYLGDVALNAVGQVAFEGSLIITEKPPTNPQGLQPPSSDIGSPPALVSRSNDTGIWATGRDGILRLVLREGQLLDVAPGPTIDLRTINLVSFISDSGNEDGRPSGLNDLGQLAFYASFTDGSSGVFVSNAVAIPEPRGWMLWAMCLPLIIYAHNTQRLRR